MADFDRRAANQKKLAEADKIQDKTEDAIIRIQRQAAEAEELGAQTLDELRRQGQQMDDINNELDSVGAKLDTSRALQTKFDAWAGNWFGGKRRAAMNEAAEEIQNRGKEDHGKIKEVFQQDRFEPFTRQWKFVNLVLCTDPSMTCTDLFDPTTAEHVKNSRWSVDYGMTNIDAEGYTYAFDFLTLNRTGVGESAPQWNSYVRRRKWRYVDKESSMAGGGLSDVAQRNEDRKTKLSDTQQSKNVEKVGYVPRNKQQSSLAASGLTSGGMMGRGGQKEEPLDEESAAGLQRLREKDARIDAGIDAISRQMDNLNNISSAMKDEVTAQNAKLEKMDSSMQKTTEKQTVVNARMKYLNK